MRVLSIVAFIALALSCEAASAVSNSHTTNIVNLDVAPLFRGIAAHHRKRSLRWRHDDKLDKVDSDDDDELDDMDSDDEERGISTGLVDDVATKVDDVFKTTGITVQQIPSKWTAALKVSTPLKRVRNLYPKGLSSSTMKQLVQTEIQRADDLTNGVKMFKTGDYKMQREVKAFEGMKTAPILKSSTGRDLQKYAADGKSREMACIVASRSAEKGGGDVLLISSSNANKNDWLLPKGGWDEGEAVTKAAMRELIEEGGVMGKIMHNLGSKDVKIGKKGYVYNSFWMKADDIFDQWPESIRYRIWVSFDDAEKLLQKRPDMVDVVKATREKAALVKSGELAAMDEKLSKLNFEP